MSGPARHLAIHITPNTERVLRIECVGACRTSRGRRQRVPHVVHDVTLNGEPYFMTTCTKCSHLSYAHAKTGGITTPFESWAGSGGAQ